MDFGLSGRRAAVAAASAGLGFAAARALAGEGARVAICGRNRDRLATAAERLGDLAVPITADVSVPEGAESFVAEAADALGGVDILVTNSGGPPPGTFTGTDTTAYPDALTQNLLSVVAMCRAAVPAMRERRWGRVVAISSIAVRQPIPGLILSNTARAGAAGFLKTLALEVARDGVTVNSLLPGTHNTERVQELDRAGMTRTSDTIPVGLLGDPRDFGAFVAFLCSDQAGFVTGTALPVDGGTDTALL